MLGRNPSKLYIVPIDRSMEIFLGREARGKLLSALQDKQGSRVITYVTSDRQGVETQIGSDAIPIFQKILNLIGDQKRIDLVLYSRGGNTVTALELVSLIREYCEEFNVIIPFRAHSSATLIALGADKIFMSKTAQLSPIDMTLTTPFNPRAPLPQGAPPQFLPIAVENMSGFVNFAKKELNLHNSEDMVGVLEILASQVTPLAIGALYRAFEKNKFLAEALLRYHMDDQTKIDAIIDRLNRGYFTHTFPISRTEAINLQLPSVTKTPDTIEQVVWDVYRQYEDLLDLTTPYSADALLRTANAQETVTRFRRGAIEMITPEGELQSFMFITEREVKEVQIAHPQLGMVPQIIERDITNKWEQGDKD